jgi:hypothetical protein
MSMNVADFKANLEALIHKAKIETVDDIDLLLERAANTFLLKCDPLDTMRVAALSNTVHDDVYNYSLPADYKRIIDLYPQDSALSRSPSDVADRKFAEPFDLDRLMSDRDISIEANNGSKILRVNWPTRSPKVINAMNSLTSNGAWAVSGTASGLKINDLFYISGGASVEFDVAASGDGIQNTTMGQVDLTDEDEVGEFFAWIYLPSAPTSISLVWGNNLTTTYWTSAAQTTQADGTAFRAGWNLVKFSWLSATETGTVDPTTIDSLKLTIASTGALANVRVDNIVCSLGKNFDIKYYSKYLITDSSGTSWKSRTTTDTDLVILDNDCIQLYLLECLIATAQQVIRKGSNVDITWAKNELNELYDAYEVEHPAQARRATFNYLS